MQVDPKSYSGEVAVFRIAKGCSPHVFYSCSPRYSCDSRVKFWIGTHFAKGITLLKILISIKKVWIKWSFSTIHGKYRFAVLRFAVLMMASSILPHAHPQGYIKVRGREVRGNEEKWNKCECSHKYVKIHTVSVSRKSLNWEMSSMKKMMRGEQSKCSIHSSDQDISQTPFSVTWMYIPLSQTISFTSLTGESWKLRISFIM